jgi:hypothetical protein
MVVEVLGGTQKRQQLMKAKRKRHDAEFKARVALEALKVIKTVQQSIRQALPR